ncbi:MAG: hypothetical protein ABF325_08115 [Lentimonas sp.]
MRKVKIRELNFNNIESSTGMLGSLADEKHIALNNNSSPASY